MNHPLTILGISGSLRRASYNRGTLRAAQQLAPQGRGGTYAQKVRGERAVCLSGATAVAWDATLSADASHG